MTLIESLPPWRELKLKKSYSLNRYVSSELKKFYQSGFVATYKLGPAPARKVSSVRGIGVTPEKVRPYPGISVQDMPCTDVFREA